jgi:hypothetical protein
MLSIHRIAIASAFDTPASTEPVAEPAMPHRQLEGRSDYLHGILNN